MAWVRIHDGAMGNLMSKKWSNLSIGSAYEGVIGPMVACVYAFFLDGVLVYVGSSEFFRERLKQHGIIQDVHTRRFWTKWGECERITIKYKKSRKPGDWLMDEFRLVRRLKPRGNKNGIIGWRNVAKSRGIARGKGYRKAGQA